jgi:DNA-binding response OmpR family regulator
MTDWQALYIAERERARDAIDAELKALREAFSVTARPLLLPDGQRLTVGEFSVIEALARYTPGTCVTVRMIAVRRPNFRASTPEADDNTVKVTMFRARRKLVANGVLVATVDHSGYVLDTASHARWQALTQGPDHAQGVAPIEGK